MADKHSLEVGHLAARFLSVSLSMGLTLDEVIVQGEGLRLSDKPFEISMASLGTMDIRVSESSLSAFLNHKAPAGLKEFRVKLHEGHVHVEAKASMIFSVNVGAVCKLRIEDETKLYVDLVRMEAIGGSGARNIVQKQLDSINPVIDVAELPVQTELISVDIENQWLVLHGTISPRAK